MNELTMKSTREIAAQATLGIEMFDRWTAFVDSSSDRTKRTYNTAIRQFVLYLKTNGITHPQREDIISYREMLKQDHKPTTIQTYMAAVKLFFKWTASEGVYPNVADHVKGAKLDTEHKKDYLTSKQVSKLLNGVERDGIQGLRDYAMLALMVTTGLRTISIVEADICDLRTVGDDMVLFYKGKGHDEKATYVKLAEPVEEAIREYLAARGEKDGTMPLFASVSNRNSSGRMTTRSVSRLAKGHMVEVNLNSDRLTAHSLRHTAATLNLLNGATLEETRQLLDHKSINTTTIYSHALDRTKNNSEKRIAKAIFG